MVILKAENISKQYRLGTVGTGTLAHDLNRFWYRVRGKEDPYLKIGAVNDRSISSNEEYVWALRDINFEVEEGEVLGIIGKNGAGKSTLLKILSKVTGPTTGIIKSNGRIASLLEVGTGFHPELTGRENIFLNGAILGMTRSEIRSKLDEIIDFSGCELYIDTPVKRYSSGMKVRLAFAVAAHLEPDIMVVDEVLAVGDAEFQKKAIGKMQDISTGEGRTVLFVSHNMAAVKSLCTRGVVLDNGRSVFEGSTDDAIHYYLQVNKEEIDKELRDRKDRKGPGNFIVSEIKTFNFQHQVSEVHLNGEDIIFEITIENKKQIPVESLQLDFGVNDSSDVRISWLSTSIFNNDFSFKSDEIIKIKLIIEKTPLFAGLYSLTTNLIVNGKPEDWIPHAVKFQIENGNFFNTGKTMIPNQGSFLIKHRFE